MDLFGRESVGAVGGSRGGQVSGGFGGVLFCFVCGLGQGHGIWISTGGEVSWGRCLVLEHHPSPLLSFCPFSHKEVLGLGIFRDAAAVLFEKQTMYVYVIVT